MVFDFVDLAQYAGRIRLSLFVAIEIMPALEIVKRRGGKPPLHFEVGDQFGVVADEQQARPVCLSLRRWRLWRESSRQKRFDRERIIDVDPFDDFLDTDRKLA